METLKSFLTKNNKISRQINSLLLWLHWTDGSCRLYYFARQFFQPFLAHITLSSLIAIEAEIFNSSHHIIEIILNIFWSNFFPFDILPFSVDIVIFFTYLFLWNSGRVVSIVIFGILLTVEAISRLEIIENTKNLIQTEPLLPPLTPDLFIAYLNEILRISELNTFKVSSVSMR